MWHMVFHFIMMIYLKICFQMKRFSKKVNIQRMYALTVRVKMPSAFTVMDMDTKIRR